MKTMQAERFLATSAEFAIRTLSESTDFSLLTLFVSPLRNGCSVGSGKSHNRDSISARKRVGVRRSGKIIL